MGLYFSPIHFRSSVRSPHSVRSSSPEARSSSTVPLLRENRAASSSPPLFGSNERDNVSRPNEIFFSSLLLYEASKQREAVAKGPAISSISIAYLDTDLKKSINTIKRVPKTTPVPPSLIQVLSSIALLSYRAGKGPKDKEHPYDHSSSILIANWSFRLGLLNYHLRLSRLDLRKKEIELQSKEEELRRRQQVTVWKFMCPSYIIYHIFYAIV